MAQLLSAVSPGTLVKLNESGSPVQFYVAAQNYESGLNGAGRTLLVRKDVYQNGQWNASNVNTYANSTIDTWFNGTYKALLDPWVQNAIGTTTFYYTPRNGNTSLSQTSRAVFALSMTELGENIGGMNIEGTVLPAASSILSALPSNTVQWTRSPAIGATTTSVWSMKNAIGTQVAYSANQSHGYRPCFTIPSETLIVLNDGSIVQSAISSITAPTLIMKGNSVPISWDGVSGADSYILQRNADNGGWTQVYAGSDTTFTDTAGSWSTVQYQVCGVFDGTNGAFAQSDLITVVPTSTLVISGQDGDLGTITSDIPYSVATDTGNQISLTRTVNGVLVASMTVNSGFAYSIPVMDLPTGTGTIVITATVQTSSDPVTVTRTWTYTKQAQTFPGSGGLAQLTQDGQNVFPLTLAEAVKTIGGPWGGNLSTALDKLAKAATYTATAVPKYTQVAVNLSTAQAGDIVNLPENGVMVPFYVASLDYEPTLNTSGTRVLLVRKDVYQKGAWNNSGVNTYANSTIDTWFNSTYKPMLDSKVLAEIGETTFLYTPGGGDNTVTTLARAVFALSLTEYGQSIGSANVEGSALPVSSILGIPNIGGSAVIQWTRTPTNNDVRSAFGVYSQNLSITAPDCSNLSWFRPCFTLPATFQATYYVDQNGTVHPEQEYTNAGDFADLWGNIIPTVKIETGSYVGTGTYGSSNPNRITSSARPLVVFIGGNPNQNRLILINGPQGASGENNYQSRMIGFNPANPAIYGVTALCPENELSWYSTSDSNQLNVSGYKYQYTVLYLGGA